jgi:hypothetical protein
MKASEIYRKAAQLCAKEFSDPDYGAAGFAPHYLGMAGGYGLPVYSEFERDFDARQLYGWDSVTALCFAAAIAESEGN